MNRILKKLVPGVLAAALALGAVPSGLSFDDILASAEAGDDSDPYISEVYGVSVAASDSYGLNVYCKFPHCSTRTEGPSNVKVHYTTPNVSGEQEAYVDNATYQPAGSNGGEYVKVSIPVYPKHVDKNVTFYLTVDGHKVHLVGGSFVDENYVFTDNVGAYCDRVEASADSAATTDAKRFAFALREYGRWANVYLANKNTTPDTPVFPTGTTLVNVKTAATSQFPEGLTPVENDYAPDWWVDNSKKYDFDSTGEHKTLFQMLQNTNQVFGATYTSVQLSPYQGYDYASQYKKMLDSNGVGYISYSASFVLDEALNIKAYLHNFNPDNSKLAPQLYKADEFVSNIYQVYKNPSSAYYYKIADLDPTEFDNKYTIKILDSRFADVATDYGSFGTIDASLNISVNGYIVGVVKSIGYNGTATSEAKKWINNGFINTLRALYAYGKAANMYASSIYA